MASGDYSGTSASGVTYDLSYNAGGILGLGASYDLTITDPDGTTQTVDGIDTSHVLTSDGGTLSLVSVLGIGGGDYVIPPGVNGTVTTLLSALSTNTVYIGGNATISGGVGSVISGTVLNIDGGTATSSSGLISALSGTTVNLTNGGTFAASGNLVSLLSGTAINFGAGGGTFVANAGGSLINLSGTAINNYNPAQDVIEFENTTSTVSGYTISGDGSSRTVTLIGADGQTQVGSYTVNLADGVTLADGVYNALSADTSKNPLQITYSNGNTYIGACFLAGSMIRTPAGEAAVENIRVGDEVSVSLNGEEAVRKVTWVGAKKVSVRSGLADDEAGYPIRVLKGAIADGAPYKDLLITPEHCLFFERRFVPARMLVNGASIFYDKSITSYDYYHFETEAHSVIWADGVLTESYLDTGNRATFGQRGPVVTLGGRQKTWEEDAAAPLDVERGFVEPLFRRIEARAKAAGLESRVAKPILTQDPDLRLVTDTGAEIRPVRSAGSVVSFMIPANVGSVRIVSRASRPSDVIGPFVDDRRVFGVAVGDLSLYEGGRLANVTAHLTDGAVPGWNALEWKDTRWTSGDALLPLGQRRPNGIALLSIQVKAAGPYVLASEEGVEAASRRA